MQARTAWLTTGNLALLLLLLALFHHAVDSVPLWWAVVLWATPNTLALLKARRANRPDESGTTT
ncbi:hypothetical protein [Streptomyces thermolilacinus]|uniref:hypothetical protein n=1 Tax=Streptomyces thermolilacinus TaxID=285540 RepID=UPI0033F56E1D